MASSYALASFRSTDQQVQIIAVRMPKSMQGNCGKCSVEDTTALF